METTRELLPENNPSVDVQSTNGSYSSNGDGSTSNPSVQDLINAKKQAFVEGYQKLVEETGCELYIVRSTVDNTHQESIGIRYNA